MSLDFYIKCECCGSELFWKNITHNLNKMASEACFYEALWRPEEIKAKRASDIIDILKDGLKELKNDPEFYKEFNPINGWGTYEVLVEALENIIAACEKYPNGILEVSR